MNSVIKIDLDGKNSLGTFISRMWMIKYLGLYIDNIKVYDTRKGYHVYLHLAQTLENWEILLIESILGDDPVRVMCSYVKLRQGVEGIEKIDVLFMEKYRVNMYNEIETLSTEEINPHFSQQIEGILNEQKSKYLQMKFFNGVPRSWGE